MTRKLIAAVWLLALAVSHGAALTTVLLAEEHPGCCTGSLCSPHRHGHQAPVNHNCDPGRDAALRSCDPPEQHVVSSQPFVLPEPPATPGEAPLVSERSPAALFFPAPPADVDSPPPRAHLV